MYNTSISQLTEDDADSYIICYNCKKLTHLMNRSIQGYINICSKIGFGMSTSTVVSECTHCCNTRTNNVTRDMNRKRLIFMKSYLEKKGDRKFIDIDKEQSPE